MTMVRSADGEYYDITVNDKERGDMRYRTQKYVHYFQAEAPRGRCTRVWQVQKLNGNNEPEGEALVLKDTWIDYDRDREGNIMEAVINDLSTAEDKETLRKILLTVLCHGDVLGPDGQQDSTRVARSDGCRFYPLYEETTTDKKARATGTNSLTNSGAYGALTSKVGRYNKPILLTRKIHYRIVFEEAGTPLNQVENLRHVFKALWNVSRGEFLWIAEFQCYNSNIHDKV